MCPLFGDPVLSLSIFRGAFYAISRHFGRNLTLWTIPCYRPKQGAFHDKSLILTPQSSHEQTKKGRRVEISIRQNDAEWLISCAYSPYLVVMSCILTVYQPINAKRSPHALYQNMRTQLANPVNYDTRDDAPCTVQQRVHLHPGAYRAIMTLLLV